MTDTELDHVYTRLAEAMGRAGEARAVDLLSRFALLAMVEIDAPARLEALIERAEESLDR